MSIETKPLCIYHDNCVDGFTAAWAVNRFFRERGGCDFHAARYGSLPPTVAGRDVIIVDFSYPADTLKLMGEMALSVLVLDHHKTAEEDLKPFAKMWPAASAAPVVGRGEVRAYFDMHRSGAGMAWDFFMPHDKRPALVDHVEDRDLWRFMKHGTREIHAVLTSYKPSFDVWDQLNDRIENPIQRASVIDEGEAIDRKHLLLCEEVIKAGRHEVMVEGVTVPVCNAPFHMASDIGNIMSVGQPFAATFFITAEGNWQYSLRSQKDGMDVSAIAKKLGGGGHRNAAGFTIKKDKR